MINNPATTFDDFLLNERIDFICRHKLMTVVGHICIATMTSVFLWSRAPHSLIFTWLLFMGAAVSFSIAIMQPPAKNSAEFNRRFWMPRAMLSAVLVGFSWGIVPPLFFMPDSTVYLIVICCIYTGYISAAIPTTFCYAPVFYSFAFGISAPFIFLLFSVDGYEYEFIRLSIFVYIGILTFAAHTIHHLFLNSTQANFEKLALIEQLKKERETAVRATKSKDQFFAAASHDLRQPLNAINLFIDALQTRLSKEDNIAILGKVRRSLRGLNGMLHSLLDISKLDASTVSNKPNDISLHALTTQLVEEYDTKAQHLELKNHVDVNTVAFADPTLLYRVVRNVLDNAIKFTKHGHVSLTSSVVDDKIKLFIKDTGIGIPSDKLDKIFDEFSQLDNPERNREKGLGLGLSIVKRLCNLGDIQIFITSVLGKGTTVMLCMPSGDAALQTQKVAQGSVDLSGRHIMVIDDEADILEGMAVVLEAWGCQVTPSDSLSTALRMLTTLNSKPDVIISDLRLKAGELGTDAIDSIRDEFNSLIPAILITGDTAPQRVALANDTGLKVLYKPIETNQLKDALNEIFDASVTPTL